MKTIGLTLGVVAATSALGGQVGQRPRLDQVPPILRLAIRSSQTLQFSGTRTVEQFIGADRSKHVEFVLRQGGRTRVWFPIESPYSGQVIVENARQRKHYFPGKNEVHVGPAKREEAFGKLMAAIGTGVRFSTEPGIAIAGKKTTMLSVLEGGNARQKLWIDVANGMILRRDLFDAVGGRVGSYEFTEIDYNPTIREGDFELDRKGAKMVTPQDEARAFARRLGLLQVAFPSAEGIRLDSARVIKGTAIPVLQLTFSKGPAVLSLFQARGRVDLPMLRRANRGSVRSYSWTAGGNTFAIIGNFGEEELKRLAGLLSAS